MKFQDHEIESIHKRGYQVEKKSPYQFRVECVLDLYPTRKRFHNLSNQARGEYPYGFDKKALQKLIEFVDAQIKTADEILDAAVADGTLGIESVSPGDGPRERRRWLGEHNPGWWTKYSRPANA